MIRFIYNSFFSVWGEVSPAACLMPTAGVFIFYALEGQAVVDGDF